MTYSGISLTFIPGYDILVFAPFAELALANLLNVKSNNDFLNTGLVILKAEAINGILVLGLKNTTNQLRPNGKNRYSFPSGHTAHAFLAASILHTELRHKSPGTALAPTPLLRVSAASGC